MDAEFFDREVKPWSIFLKLVRDDFVEKVRPRYHTMTDEEISSEASAFFVYHSCGAFPEPVIIDDIVQHARNELSEDSR